MARPFKQMERWGKSLAMRSLAAMVPERRSASPDWTARPFRALYLRYDRIGDMILSSGLFRALVTANPRMTLDVLASPANRTVLDHNPHVGEVLVFDKRHRLTIPATIRALRRNRYDVVIDPMIETPSLIATLLMLASGAPYRVGIGGRTNAFGYTLPVDAPRRDVHHTLQEAALLEPFGVDAGGTDLHPEIFTSREEREAAEAVWAGVGTTMPADRSNGAGASPGYARGMTTRRLLVNISTFHASRRWPVDRFADVIRALRSMHESLSAIVIGLPRDRDLAQWIAQASGARAVATPGLRDALALVATADAVFTPDTSISHAAAASHTPAVVMLGPGRAAFEPFRIEGRLLRADTDDFTSVTAAQATEALDAVLARTASRSGVAEDPVRAD